MTENQALLSSADKEALLQIAAAQNDLNGRRAAALVAIDRGQAIDEAADSSGLTEGQVNYILRKYREQGLDAFPATVVSGSTAADNTDETEQLRSMVAELNKRVEELQAMVDAQGANAGNASMPLRLLTTIRDNAQKLTPDMQLDILRNFQGMSAEDLLDIDTWKGMAYMMAYSARFQAGQVRDRVTGTINHVVPEPVQPARLWQWGKKSLDRITPDIAKQIVSTFEGATREDLLDLDTWKGIAYMINYSIQFQAEQLKQRLTGETDTKA